MLGNVTCTQAVKSQRIQVEHGAIALTISTAALSCIRIERHEPYLRRASLQCFSQSPGPSPACTASPFAPDLTHEHFLLPKQRACAPSTFYRKRWPYAAVSLHLSLHVLLISMQLQMPTPCAILRWAPAPGLHAVQHDDQTLM